MPTKSSGTTFNPKRDLPYLAAIAQAAQFALAGSVLLGDKGWIFGGLLGLLISVTMAYASSQYDGVAKSRQPFAFAMMVCVGLISPVIIGTSMFLDLPQTIHPIWRGVVGAVWGILPDASVALTGFVAGKGLVKKEDSPKDSKGTTEKPKEKQKKKQDAPGKVARKHITDEELVTQIKQHPEFDDEQLAQLFGVSRQAINKRRHKLTPAQLGF